MKISKSFLFLALFAFAAPASAAFTPHFNFQGRLTDANGNPVTTPKTVVFSLWRTSTTAISILNEEFAVFTETHTVIPDANGVYTALIGSINQTIRTVFFGVDTWLEVTVEGEILSPRLSLSSVPNALSAEWHAVSSIPPQYLYGSGLQRDVYVDLNDVTVHLDPEFLNFSTIFSAQTSSTGPPYWTVDVDMNPSSATLQGNTFNIAGKLLRLDGAGALPSLNAPSLTLLGSTLTVRGSAMRVGTNGFAVREGMVGIGKAVPLAKLHISSGGFIQDGADPYVNIGDLTFVVTNRRIGIGTASPDVTLAVNGDASKTGGGTWQTFSDLRLKDVTGPYSHGLKEILQLNPVRYRYKADNPLKLPGDRENIGFIAQDVQRVIPEAVRETSNGYLTLGSDPLLWSLVNAIKEMSARNETLRARIAQLEKLRSR